MKGLKIISVAVGLMLLASCEQQVVKDVSYVLQRQICEETTCINDEMVALSDVPNLPNSINMPVAAGTSVKENDQAVIDYSNIADGYVMVKFKASSANRLKVQVTRETTYTYDLRQGEWTTFPLSDGNGEYKVTVFENISDNKYSTVISETINVSLKDEFAPFLRPNQYVNYENAPDTVNKAEEIAGGTDDALEKVAAVYDFVVDNLTYDKDKAKNVQSGYLPVLDSVLKEKKGICFDYAALMTAMLRSQGIPCKLVVGYAGNVYHSWISVWSEGTGWVDAAIYFDGTTWQRMDPTFISANKNSESIQKFVGDGNNYTPKYLY